MLNLLLKTASLQLSIASWNPSFFGGKLTTRVGTLQTVRLFSKLNKTFVGYFDPENKFFWIMKITDFWGDLTDASAKKERLVAERARA